MTTIADEAIVEPELPIVDPHHHLWLCTERPPFVTDESSDDELMRYVAAGVRSRRRYLFDELMADLMSGHNIRGTVFMESSAMYRASGPEAMRSVGEVEFATGAAAMAASGAFGDVKACAGIVGLADLRLGDAVEDVLAAHVAAGGGRYRGVRNSSAHEPGSKVGTPHLLLDRGFRAGFKRLQALGLSFDAFLRVPQIPELVDLAHAFPETPIILDHLGAPVRGERDALTRDERFARWRDGMHLLSACPNVVLKIGGPVVDSVSTASFTSETFATAWRPYFETCVEAFGVHRCMFESDYPAAAGVGAYAMLWNAFKRLAADASDAEKTALFSGTATRVYRLEL